MAPDVDWLLQDHCHAESVPDDAPKMSAGLTLLTEAWARHPEWHNKVLPYAMPVPGMLHVIHNLLKDANHGLEDWVDFWGFLSNLGGLLSNSLRLNSFCATCLDGVPSQRYWEKVMTGSKLPALYEKRWNVVMHFVRRAAPKICALRVHWNPNLYGREEEQDGSRFSPCQLTEDLNNPYWSAYLDMISQVHDVVEKFRGQCEGCTCHPPDLLPDGRLDLHGPGRRQALGRDGSCPLEGRHAPEFAAGEWQDVLAGLWRISHAELAEKHMGKLESASDSLASIWHQCGNAVLFIALGALLC